MWSPPPPPPPPPPRQVAWDTRWSYFASFALISFLLSFFYTEMSGPTHNPVAESPSKGWCRANHEAESGRVNTATTVPVVSIQFASAGNCLPTAFETAGTTFGTTPEPPSQPPSAHGFMGSWGVARNAAVTSRGRGGRGWVAHGCTRLRVLHPAGSVPDSGIVVVNNGVLHGHIRLIL